MKIEEQIVNLEELLEEIDKEGLNRKSFQALLVAYSYEQSMAENILYWLYRYEAIDDQNIEKIETNPKALRSLEVLAHACRERIDESFLSNYASSGWIQNYLRSKCRRNEGARFEDFVRAASGREVLNELANILPDQGVLDRLTDLKHPHDQMEWMGIAREKLYQKIENGLSAACRKRVFNVRNISDYFMEVYMADAYRALRQTLGDDADALTLLISNFEAEAENFELGAKYSSQFKRSESTILDFELEQIFGNGAIVLERDGLLKSKLAPLTQVLAQKLGSMRIPRGDYFENVPLRHRTSQGDLFEKIVPIASMALLLISIFYLRFLLPFWFMFIIFFYILRPYFARHGGVTAVVRRIVLTIKGLFRK